MKNIKSFFIGFLSCISLVLIMGQTSIKKKIPVEQNNMNYQFIVQRGVEIGETYYLYNNQTEEIQILHPYVSKDGEQKWSSMSFNFRKQYDQGLEEDMNEVKKKKSTIIGK